MKLKISKKSTSAFCATLLLLFLFTLSLPILASAANYVPLAPIPGTITNTNCGNSLNPVSGNNAANEAYLSSCGTDLSTYLTGIFKVGIAIAGVLAFLMIVLGGFQYLSTDAITGKEEGKERVMRALGGLVLALVSYIVLYTINPNLVILNLKFNFGEPIRQVTGSSAPSSQTPGELALQKFIEDNNKRAAANEAAGIAKEQTAEDMLYQADNDLSLFPEEREALIDQAYGLLEEAALSRSENTIATAGNLGTVAAQDGHIAAAQNQLDALKQEISTGINNIQAINPTDDDIKEIDALALNGTNRYSILAEGIAKQAIIQERLPNRSDYAEKLMTDIQNAEGQALAKVNDPDVAAKIDEQAQKSIAAIRTACRTANLPCKNYR